MRHGTGEGRNFKKLDEQAYPLSKHTGNYSVITGPVSKEITDPYDLEEPESIYHQDTCATGIKVRKEWEVEKTASVPSKSLFGNVSQDWESDPNAGMPLPLPHGL